METGGKKYPSCGTLKKPDHKNGKERTRAKKFFLHRLILLNKLTFKII